jgi:hypothetical protein
MSLVWFVTQVPSTLTYLNIDGMLWTFVSLKTSPDGTYPGILRMLMTIAFPVVISTQVTISDQRVGDSINTRRNSLFRGFIQRTAIWCSSKSRGHHVTATASILSIAYNCPTAASSMSV